MSSFLLKQISGGDIAVLVSQSISPVLTSNTWLLSEIPRLSKSTALSGEAVPNAKSPRIADSSPSLNDTWGYWGVFASRPSMQSSMPVCSTSRGPLTTSRFVFASWDLEIDGVSSKELPSWVSEVTGNGKGCLSGMSLSVERSGCSLTNCISLVTGISVRVDTTPTRISPYPDVERGLDFFPWATVIAFLSRKANRGPYWHSRFFSMQLRHCGFPSSPNRHAH